jgi:hypothetical protein
MNKNVILLSLIISLLGNFKAASQVNLQTGAAEYGIPLYSYSDAKNRIGTGVSLVYIAGNGLKVSEIPSSVGTGWDISAGGFIQRMQHGEPDDQKRNGGTYSYMDNGTYFPNGYLYSEFDPSLPVDNGAAYTPLFFGELKYLPEPKYQADREQDVFLFSFNGRSGEFVIGKNGEIKTLVDSKLKIEKDTADMIGNNIRTKISEFRIIDETGIKYVFRELELGEIIEYDNVAKYVYGNTAPLTPNFGQYYYYGNGSSPPSISYRTLIKGTATNKFIVTKWCLSEIINPLTNNKIIFNYESYNVDMNGNKLAQMSTVDNQSNITVTVDRIKGVSKRLTSITCSSKEVVEFKYPAYNRNDLAFDKYLQEIVIKYDGVQKTKWLFSYGYFYINQILDENYGFSQYLKDYSRLCLKSIRRIGSGQGQENPYIFNYNLGTGLYGDKIPPMFSPYQDQWGYYNYGGTAGGEPLNDPYAILYSPNYSYMLPNGAVSHQLNNLVARNGILQSIQFPLGGTLAFEFEQNVVLTPAPGLQEVTAGGVRVKKTLLYDGNDHSKDVITEYIYKKESGVSSGWGYELGIYSETNTGTVYKCNGKVPAVRVAKYAIPMLMHMVGYAIKYEVGFLSQAVVSNVIVPTVIAFVLSYIIQIVVEWLGPDHQDFTAINCSSSSLIDANPLPLQYSRVEVVNKNLAGTAGKTVYEFRSPADDPFDVPILASPYSSRQRFVSWAYGVPLKTFIYDNTGHLVKKIENTYTMYKSPYGGANFTSQKWRPNRADFNCNIVPGSYYTANIDWLSHDYYSPLCGRIELQSTKEYLYNANNEFAFTETSFEYSPDNYMLKKVKSKNSKNEDIEATTFYPQEYNLSGAIQTMKNSNILNIPVSSQTTITKSGPQKYILSGSISEFGTAGNGDIKVINTYSFKNDQPLLATQAPFNPNQLNFNATYFTPDLSMTYNTPGNVVQTNGVQERASVIYDYDNCLPVATVMNADIGSVAYSSFETGGSGGWTINPGSTIVTERALTGNKSFSGALLKTVPTGNYTITLWSVSWGTMNVNGLQGTTIANVGIWRLYEWKLTNVTNIIIQADNIDEVRLYPSNATMATCTYDPLIGKTSECDASNRILYYEYDDLGRLRLIRDENRNIVKMYEYNYKR